MDFLDDFLSELTAVEAPAPRFQPKGKRKDKKGQSSPPKSLKEQSALQDAVLSESAVHNDLAVTESEVPGSSLSTNTADTCRPLGDHYASTLVSSSIQIAEVPGFPDVSFSGASPFRRCTSQNTLDRSSPVYQDSADFQRDVEQLETGDFSSPDGVEVMGEGGTASGMIMLGNRAVTFQPKPRAHDKAKNLHKPIDEPDDLDDIHGGSHGNNNIHTKSPEELASSKDVNDVGDHSVEGTFQKKRGRRKVKKVSSENDKSTRKRTKASEEPDHSINKPPKKFPHATQRKRCVNKSLLEIPEDELDLQKLRIKDLILLAEFKQRRAKKEATTVQTLPNEERTDSLPPEDLPYDDYDDTYGLDQDRDSTDKPSTSIKIDTGYYNYHSYRNIVPRGKWTKMDTELFYQGIRQFGTDLSMIQQLFPGRTREQMRSKYKKEEREHPMLLDDALSSRTKDLSHFKLVVERLEEAERVAKEADQSQDEEDFFETFLNPTGEEGMAEKSPTNEATKFEQKEQDEGTGVATDGYPIGSPAESDNGEEEFSFMGYRGFD